MPIPPQERMCYSLQAAGFIVCILDFTLSYNQLFKLVAEYKCALELVTTQTAKQEVALFIGASQ